MLYRSQYLYLKTLFLDVKNMTEHGISISKHIKVFLDFSNNVMDEEVI